LLDSFGILPTPPQSFKFFSTLPTMHFLTLKSLHNILLFHFRWRWLNYKLSWWYRWCSWWITKRCTSGNLMQKSLYFLHFFIILFSKKMKVFTQLGFLWWFQLLSISHYTANNLDLLSITPLNKTLAYKGDMWKTGRWFSLILRFPPIKLIATISLKYFWQ
jgi:hypothetical protein